jgi:hypothetical protein
MFHFSKYNFAKFVVITFSRTLWGKDGVSGISGMVWILNLEIN